LSKNFADFSAYEYIIVDLGFIVNHIETHCLVLLRPIRWTVKVMCFNIVTHCGVDFETTISPRFIH